MQNSLFPSERPTLIYSVSLQTSNNEFDDKLFPTYLFGKFKKTFSVTMPVV